MVKRSRDQSQEAPSRLSWLMMVPPDSAFQAQTFSRNFSRPSARRSGSWRSMSWRSTTIWVAMPAWSVPGCQSTSLAAHALEARQHVLQGVVERMAHMQRAGDVGRRNDDAIGLGVAPLGPAAAERARLLPGGVDAPLDRRRAGMSCRSLLFRSGGFAVKSPPRSALSTPAT